MFKIALTGGPCSGKSTVLERLKTLPTGVRYRVAYLSEVASELLKERTPYIDGHDDLILRQFYIYRTQLAMENCLAEELAKESERETVLITDRGISDALAYLDEGDVEKVLKGREEETFTDRYDAVLFFEPTGEKQFEARNNAARLEQNYEEILVASRKTKQAWEKYYRGRLFSVGMTDDVEEKVLKTAKIINTLLGGKVYDV